MSCVWGREGNGGHDRRRVYGLRPVAANIWAMPGLGSAAAGSYRCYGAGSRWKGAHHGWAFPGTAGKVEWVVTGRGRDQIEARPTIPSSLGRTIRAVKLV